MKTLGKTQEHTRQKELKTPGKKTANNLRIFSTLPCFCLSLWPRTRCHPYLDGQHCWEADDPRSLSGLASKTGWNELQLLTGFEFWWCFYGLMEIALQKMPGKQAGILFLWKISRKTGSASFSAWWSFWFYGLCTNFCFFSLSIHHFCRCFLLQMKFRKIHFFF